MVAPDVPKDSKAEQPPISKKEKAVKEEKKDDMVCFQLHRVNSIILCVSLYS